MTVKARRCPARRRPSRTCRSSSRWAGRSPLRPSSSTSGSGGDMPSHRSSPCRPRNGHQVARTRNRGMPPPALGSLPRTRAAAARDHPAVRVANTSRNRCTRTTRRRAAPPGIRSPPCSSGRATQRPGIELALARELGAGGNPTHSTSRARSTRARPAGAAHSPRGGPARTTAARTARPTAARTLVRGGGRARGEHA